MTAACLQKESAEWRSAGALMQGHVLPHSIRELALKEGIKTADCLLSALARQPEFGDDFGERFGFSRIHKQVIFAIRRIVDCLAGTELRIEHNKTRALSEDSSRTVFVQEVRV